MFKLKKTVVISILLIIVGAVGVWSFLFQDLDTKIKNDIKSGEHVVLLFSAEWCGTCKKQKPVYKKVKTEFPNIRFYLVGSELSKIKQKIFFKYYSIRGLPEFIIFKDGKEQMRLIGFQTEEKLRESFSQ